MGTTRTATTTTSWCWWKSGEQKLMKITHDLFILIFAFTFLYATTNWSLHPHTLERRLLLVVVVVHIWWVLMTTQNSPPPSAWEGKSIRRRSLGDAEEPTRASLRWCHRCRGDWVAGSFHLSLFPATLHRTLSALLALCEKLLVQEKIYQCHHLKKCALWIFIRW